MCVAYIFRSFYICQINGETYLELHVDLLYLFTFNNTETTFITHPTVWFVFRAQADGGSAVGRPDSDRLSMPPPTKHHQPSVTTHSTVCCVCLCSKWCMPMITCCLSVDSLIVYWIFSLITCLGWIGLDTTSRMYNWTASIYGTHSPLAVGSLCIR
jgi:hypothetical protein